MAVFIWTIEDVITYGCLLFIFGLFGCFWLSDKLRELKDRRNCKRIARQEARAEKERITRYLK